MLKDRDIREMSNHYGIDEEVYFFGGPGFFLDAFFEKERLKKERQITPRARIDATDYPVVKVEELFKPGDIIPLNRINIQAMDKQLRGDVVKRVRWIREIPEFDDQVCNWEALKKNYNAVVRKMIAAETRRMFT